MNTEPDPIVGKWNFPKNNIFNFTPDGDVLLCGSRVAVWQRVTDRKYFVLYLRGHFDGASDPLEIQAEGKWMKGLANGKHTRDLERIEGDHDPTSILGVWDYKNNNMVTFTEDGWADVCGMHLGVWRREGENSFLTVHLRGYYGGASDPLVLSEDGSTLDGLIYGNWETSTLNRA